MAPTPRIEGRRGSMEARGDVDTARQMGRLEAIRPRWDRDGGGSVVRFRDRSTRRTQISRHSISGAELRVDHAPTCQRRRNRHFSWLVWARFCFLFRTERFGPRTKGAIVCFGGGQSNADPQYLYFWPTLAVWNTGEAFSISISTIPRPVRGHKMSRAPPCAL